MHGKSRVSSEYLFAIINNFKIDFSTVAVAQWVRCWSSGHRMVQAESSSPGGNVHQFFFNNDFYFSFVRPNGLQ